MSCTKTVSKNIVMFGVTGIFLLFLSAASYAENVRFVVIGDNNSFNIDILGEVAQATVDEDPDFVLFTGDLTFGYKETQAEFELQLMDWRNTMQPVYDANIAVYPCRGNHDSTGVKPEIDPTGVSSKAAWDNVFSGPYALPGNGPAGEENITFSFTYKNVFVVGLDIYGTHPHQVNQAWLDEQLESNTKPHVFVFGHEPAFKVFHEDCLDDYPEARNAFWDSIAGHCGRTYFVGHDHAFNHARIDDGDGNPDNDIHQFVAGSSGAPFYNWSGSYDGDNGTWIPQPVYYEQQYGYVLIEIDDFTVTVTAKHRTAPGVYESGGDVFTYSVSRCKGNPLCPATFLFGENDPRLYVLRKFRDETLLKSAAGRSVVHLYYTCGDLLIKVFRNNPAIKAEAKELLETMIPKLNIFLN